jgi:hypothetical protein
MDRGAINCGCSKKAVGVRVLEVRAKEKTAIKSNEFGLFMLFHDQKCHYVIVGWVLHKTVRGVWV